VDFIERWFNVSPDGGNGTLEWLSVALGALVVSVLVIAMRRHFPRVFWWYVEELGEQEIRDPERVHYFEKSSHDAAAARRETTPSAHSLAHRLHRGSA